MVKAWGNLVVFLKYLGNGWSYGSQIL